MTRIIKVDISRGGDYALADYRRQTERRVYHVLAWDNAGDFVWGTEEEAELYARLVAYDRMMREALNLPDPPA